MSLAAQEWSLAAWEWSAPARPRRQSDHGFGVSMSLDHPGDRRHGVDDRNLAYLGPSLTSHVRHLGAIWLPALTYASVS